MALAEKRDHAEAKEELGVNGIVELATGYQRAQVLFAANALDVFGALAGRAKSAAEVAQALGLGERGVRALLDACVALKLLRRSGDGYANSMTVRMFLKPEGEVSFAPVLRFWQQFSYGVWGRLENAVRDNRPQTATGPKPDDLFGQLLSDPDQTRLFFDGLAGLAYWPAKSIAEAVDFSGRRHLLDLGGGSGAFSAGIARRHEHLRVTLFDLAPVCRLARERFARAGLDARVEAVAGDFFHDAYPEGIDCALIANVLHDWSAPECVTLLQKVYAALPPGGLVLIYEVSSEAAQPTIEESLFSLALLLDTNRGRSYRVEEFVRWLGQTGFRDVRSQSITAGTSLITGVKAD
jgi:predicted O-methyltransferase YrrM